MNVVGVDENGLGPRLGPLIATAMTIEIDPPYEPRRLKKIAARVGIGDSKAQSAFGAMAHAEGIALAIVEHVSGAVPSDVDALLSMIAIDSHQVLRAACDRSSERQCWGTPLALPVWGGSIERGRAALARLLRAGVRLRSAKSAIACARVFNREVARRGSKLSVDLELFERLLIDARSRTGQDVLAICGMVGGIRRYKQFLARIDVESLEVIEETSRRAVYRSPSIGEIRFEVDCDDAHVPVALASMLGKYLREVLMERQTRFYQSHAPSLPSASGYYDPITSRFVTESLVLRRRLEIADDCFERSS